MSRTLIFFEPAPEPTTTGPIPTRAWRHSGVVCHFRIPSLSHFLGRPKDPVLFVPRGKEFD